MGFKTLEFYSTMMQLVCQENIPLIFSQSVNQKHWSHPMCFSAYVILLIGLQTLLNSTFYVKYNMGLLKHSSTQSRKSHTSQELRAWSTGWRSGVRWWAQPGTCRTSPSGCSTSPR